MTALPDVAGTYRRLLGVPVLRGLAIADICARLPQGMVSITLLLVTATHASMTTAALVVTGYTLGQGVTGPLRGRLADRRGLAAVCTVCGALYSLALLCLLAASLARGPAWLLVAAGTAAGLTVPPLSPGMRSLWSAHAAGPLRNAAFALDAAVFDLAYIAGPVVASSLAVGLAPAAAVGLLLALTGTAVVIVGARPRLTESSGPSGRRDGVRIPSGGMSRGADPSLWSIRAAGHPIRTTMRVWPTITGAGRARKLGRDSRIRGEYHDRIPPGTATAGAADGSGGRPQPDGGPGSATGQRGDSARPRWSVLGALNSAALRRLLITGALVNVALSATEVALTAYVRQRHALWASGPLLAEVSIGSIAGSLLLGARTAAAEPAGGDGDGAKNPGYGGRAGGTNAGGGGSAGGGGGTGDGSRRLPRLLVWYALGLAVLAAAGLHAPLIAVAAPVAGLCLGPSLATLFGLASSAAPGGGGTESQAWLNSAMNGGAAAGAALAAATAGRPVLAMAIAAGMAAVAGGSCAGGSRPGRRNHHASAMAGDHLADGVSGSLPGSRAHARLAEQRVGGTERSQAGLPGHSGRVGGLDQVSADSPGRAGDRGRFPLISRCM